MKFVFNKNDSLTKIVQEWKEHQGMVSLTFEELLKELNDEEIFVSEKIDGELEGMEYNGTLAKFSSKDGRIRTDMPVLKEIQQILKKSKIKHIVIIGEIAKTSSHGKPVHFNDTMSAIRKPENTEEEDRIEFFPFEIYSIEGKKVSSNYNDYKESFKKLQELFSSSKHIYPVEKKIGKKSDLEPFLKKHVEKEKNEGIVVRTNTNKIFKSKPIFTLDLCVIAIQEGKGENKGRMGALILSFFDGENFYKVVNLGVGFSFKDRSEWWKLANKNKVKKEDDTIWVDPFKLNKVIETSYERLNYHLVDTYIFKKSNWEKVEDKFASTISKPGFVRERNDKSVNKNDLRLSQLPDFEKNKKDFEKNSKLFINSEHIVRSFFREQYHGIC